MGIIGHYDELYRVDIIASRKIEIQTWVDELHVKQDFEQHIQNRDLDQIVVDESRVESL